MRKSLFLMLVLSLCTADFCAFAATRGGRPSAPSANAARAGKLTTKASPTQKAVPTQNASNDASKTQGVAVRAGKKQTVAPQPAVMAARAGATQKVLQQGTKVATTTTNTVVPQECQDAFFGCMDSFCMMDNVSGGRCQCSDRISDLDKALEEILKLDEQTALVKNEGVQRIQMGEAADQIMARAKAAADKVTVQDGVVIGGKSNGASTTSNKKSLLQDLSAFNSNIFGDDDEDIFNTAEKESNLVDTFANKKGDDLYKAAAKMCVSSTPTQCKQYDSMVQLVYAQKIKSDCVSYENALKQQNKTSKQNLLAAQTALRQAALEEYNDQNKYATQGECVMAFDQCMQTTAGCGSDYTACIADDTVLTMGTDGSKGAATSASVKTSASAIGISANTLAMLTDKAMICESVLKQCQNVRNGVWEAYLKMIVPTLKSAEVTAEENRRMNCVGNIVDCFTKACAAQWPNQESAEYDMCLSNPDIVSNLCQTQINKCSTGQTGAQVMEYVKAKLQAMRVDACTTEVKACLQDQNNCGADYLQCIGLDKDIIVKMCTNSATNYKLMACQSKFNNNQYDVQNYVAQVAQGLILNLDNAALAACEEAGKKAMKDFCGSETQCSSETIAKTITFDSTDNLASRLAYTYCPSDAKTGDIKYNKCRQNVNTLVYADFNQGSWTTVLGGQLNFGCFEFNNGTIDVNATSVVNLEDLEDMTPEDKAALEATKAKEAKALKTAATPRFYPASSSACRWGWDGNAGYAEASRVADVLTKKLQRLLGKIESGTTVQQCTMGRDLKGITTYVKDDDDYSDYWTMKSTSGVGKGSFPNLMVQYREIVADAVLQNAATAYAPIYEEYIEKNEAKAEKALADRIEAIKKEVASVEAANALTDAVQSVRCRALQHLDADTAQKEVNNVGYSNISEKYYDPNSQTVKTKSSSQLMLNGLIGGGRGLYVNNIKTTYEKNNNRCKIVTESYKCSKHKYLSLHKCQGKYDKVNSKTEYLNFGNTKKSVSNTRYYN